MWKVVLASLRNRPEDWKRESHHVKHKHGFMIWSANKDYGLCGALKMEIQDHKEPLNVPPDHMRKDLWHAVERILDPALREAEDEELYKINKVIDSLAPPAGAD